MGVRLAIGVAAAVGGAAVIAVLVLGDDGTPPDPCAGPELPRECLANYVPGVPNVNKAVALARRVWGSRFGEAEHDRSGETTVLRIYVVGPTRGDRRRYAAELGPAAAHVEIEAVAFSATEVERAADEAGRLLKRHDIPEYEVVTAFTRGWIVVATPKPLAATIAAEIRDVTTVPVRFRVRQLGELL